MRWLPLAPALIAIPIWHAHAAEPDDWCKKVTLPSNIVLCSDPELLALAVERQHAYEDARARVGEEGAKALLADQNRWVATYPVACGISQNAPPLTPVSDSVKACFKRAGEARIAYLRDYGTTAAPVQLAPQPTPIRITKERFWCPFFQRYYPEAQTCPTGSWQKITQELECRGATDADDVARCRRLAEEQAKKQAEMHGTGASTPAPSPAPPPPASSGASERTGLSLLHTPENGPKNCSLPPNGSLDTCCSWLSGDGRYDSCLQYYERMVNSEKNNKLHYEERINQAKLDALPYAVTATHLPTGVGVVADTPSMVCPNNDRLQWMIDSFVKYNYEIGRERMFEVDPENETAG